ncbi:MAG: hypothetical protein H7273_10935 [Polaromonas sp.]|nr:hypothetical protein [Polaromonas sp.]
MRAGICLLAVAASINLPACAPLAFPGDPPAYRLRIDGETFLLRQLTESTWTVSSAAPSTTLATSPAASAQLRQAVETASGCQVSDSDYSLGGRQFDAQVDCPGRRAR